MTSCAIASRGHSSIVDRSAAVCTSIPAFSSAPASNVQHKAASSASEHSRAGATHACSLPALLRPPIAYAKPCPANVAGTAAAIQTGSGRFTVGRSSPLLIGVHAVSCYGVPTTHWIFGSEEPVGLPLPTSIQMTLCEKSAICVGSPVYSEYVFEGV